MSVLSALKELINLPLKTRRSMGIEFTPKEIFHQPRVWMKNFEMLKKMEDEIRVFVEERILKKGNSRVILSGAGTSKFIGLSVEGLLRSKWRRIVETWGSTEIITDWRLIFLGEFNTIMISFSRSGNSPESIGAILLANRSLKEVNHIIVSCNRHGRLAQLASGLENSLVLLCPDEANDRGLAMTSSFTTMTSTAQFLAYIREPEEYGGIIRSLSEAAESLIMRYSALLREVSELNFDRAFFLGSGSLYGCAVESSLKLQELTAGRVICKSDSYMGLRHGPEVAVDDKSILVFYVSNDPFTQRYELDLMRDLHNKRLGLVKIAVCNRSNEEISRYVDHVIELDPEGRLGIPDRCRTIVDVIVAQMLALFKSLSLGLKPDNPSEKGVITRVVRGVRIYDHEEFMRTGRFKPIIG